MTLIEFATYLEQLSNHRKGKFERHCSAAQIVEIFNAADSGVSAKNAAALIDDREARRAKDIEAKLNPAKHYDAAS